MESVLEEEMRDWRVGGSPWSEWWAVFETVVEAFEGFRSWGFGNDGAGGTGPAVVAEGFVCEAKNDGGKCFAL